MVTKTSMASRTIDGRAERRRRTETVVLAGWIEARYSARRELWQARLRYRPAGGKTRTEATRWVEATSSEEALTLATAVFFTCKDLLTHERHGARTLRTSPFESACGYWHSPPASASTTNSAGQPARSPTTPPNTVASTV